MIPPKRIRRDIGVYYKSFRDHFDLTQEELAKLLKCDRSRISRIESELVDVTLHEVMLVKSLFFNMKNNRKPTLKEHQDMVAPITYFRGE